jgi:hypothetical protein
MESWWADLEPVQLSDAVNQKAVTQVKDYLKAFSFDKTVKQRDDILVTLLKLKAAASELP